MGVQVANEEGARRAVALGADFLICQGIEAGGHVQSTQRLRDVLLAANRSYGGRIPLVTPAEMVTATTSSMP